MLALRALTAVALLGLLAGGAFLLDPAGFALFVAVVVCVAAYEWARLSGLSGWPAYGYVAAQLAACLGLWYVAGVRPAGSLHAGVWVCAAAFWLLGVTLWLWRGVSASARPVLRAAGFMVLVPAALAMAALPPLLLFSLLGIVWIADTAAYGFGRAFGRRKLAPQVSPGKTWEGAIGGTLSSLAYAIILAACWPALGERVSGAAAGAYLTAVTLLSVMSILGDLFESALKRQAGAKDSGALLPGHGGVLDRIDSATAMLPVGALLAHAGGFA